MLRCLIVLLGVVALYGTTAPTSLAAQGEPTAAAVADSTVEVRLRDGSRLYGRIVEQNETRVVLVTTGGTRVELERTQIERIRTVAARGADGSVWEDDPNATRLFFTSTARPLEKGQGYVSSFMLFFPFVAYGVTDRITLAGGTPILPGLIGRVFYAAPKVTLFDRGKTSFALGGLGFISTEAVNEGSVGILYGATTYGSRDRAITVGAGWGYATGGGFAGFTNEPVVVLGGETRVSRRVKLITENWLYFGSGDVEGIVSGGFRFIGDRLSADLGIGGVLSTTNGCCIPLVNFVYTFGPSGR